MIKIIEVIVKYKVSENAALEIDRWLSNIACAATPHLILYLGTGGK